MKHIERIAVTIALVLIVGTLVVGFENTVDVRTPVAPLAPAPRTTPSSAVRTQDAGGASNTTSQPPLALASSRHPRQEEIVRLPRQIQDQVARTVLTPAPRFSDGEILALPWQIQDQVRQTQLPPTN